MNANNLVKFQLDRNKQSNQLEVGGSSAQYLMFSLGSETFATKIKEIREIIEVVSMTKVPLTPDFMRGVINLRGAVVPVIDLAARFGRELTKIGRRTCIVIIELEIEDSTHLMGIIVDSVTEVTEVDPELIGTPPDFGLGLRADFIAGMITKGEEFIVILNMNSILSAHELEQLVQLKQQALGSSTFELEQAQ